ncbi:metal-binding protein [Oxynema sp. CENA135]|uniref:metal-binding protein n=1 Tax=Oxynema sp. CENA135 TaxID=984206 RepID=UPI00190BA6A9|nr:metal-binding protein [Oxynema sp. CENA135]MBK4732948.1 metal-binding protein [Oxynema sp. CENA135]
MPSGRTHDRITLWTLPFVAIATYSTTRNSSLTLVVAGGFLFSGLMFGPDLDIYSCQFQRWGWLRWLWIPYQKSLRHRSFLSHGPIIGTALRVLYLSIWVLLAGVVGLSASYWLFQLDLDWREVKQVAGRSLVEYSPEAIALLLGLELGALSHSLSDWCSSGYKRLKAKGVLGWKRPKKASKGKRRSPRQTRSVKKRSSKR